MLIKLTPRYSAVCIYYDTGYAFSLVYSKWRECWNGSRVIVLASQEHTTSWLKETPWLLWLYVLYHCLTVCGIVSEVILMHLLGSEQTWCFCIVLHWFCYFHSGTINEHKKLEHCPNTYRLHCIYIDKKIYIYI